MKEFSSMGNFRCILFCFVILQVTLKFTSALTLRDDVSKCITATKNILLDQQNSTRSRFDELKQRILDDAQQFQDKKYVNLNTAILKEKGILSNLRDSVAKKNFDPSVCGNISNIYDLIRSSFNASAKEIAAEFNVSLNRNYTQNLFLVNQFAQSYVRLEMQLQKCGSNNNSCFDKLLDQCDDVRIQDKMGDLETKFSIGSETILYTLFTPKIEKIYLAKSKDVSSQSQTMKDCYKSDGAYKNGIQGRAEFNIRSMQFLVIFPLLFIVL